MAEKLFPDLHRKILHRKARQPARRHGGLIGEGVLTSGVAEEMGTMGPSCVEKSRKVPGEFRRIAAETGVHFLDANEVGCKFNEVDFMHLTKTSHARLAEALAALVPELL